ncbi:Ca2+/Na+ antiporter [Oxalobacteraceae bacterium GrIS 1.11]
MNRAKFHPLTLPLFAALASVGAHAQAQSMSLGNSIGSLFFMIIIPVALALTIATLMFLQRSSRALLGMIAGGWVLMMAAAAGSINAQPPSNLGFLGVVLLFFSPWIAVVALAIGRFCTRPAKTRAD